MIEAVVFLALGAVGLGILSAGFLGWATSASRKYVSRAAEMAVAGNGAGARDSLRIAARLNSAVGKSTRIKRLWSICGEAQSVLTSTEAQEVKNEVASWPKTGCERLWEDDRFKYTLLALYIAIVIARFLALF